jgi:mitochondrial chaperone BCS1
MIDILHNPIITNAFHEVQKAFSQNQFASGGLALGIVGALFAWLRTAPSQLWNWAYSRAVLTVEVDSRDDAFAWFAVWLAAHPSKTRMRDLGLTTRHHSLEGGFLVGEDENAPRALLAPTGGTLWIRFENRWFWLESSREKSRDNGVLVGIHESVSIRTFVWNRALLEKMVREAYRSTVKPEEKRVEIMTPRWDDWRTISRVIPRDPASLVYEGDLFANIVNDTKKFLEGERWYTDMGIPWRRGYLLYGAPGNGKSSLITAVAGALGKSVCVLNLASGALTDESLQNLLSDAPEGALILLEDVDAVFHGRKIGDANASKLSFNGVLNALDGVTAQQGRMVFMTTNHLERLDPALVRPGRADVHVHVDNATRDQVRRMLERFLPELEGAAELASRVEDKALSMARIQEFLVRHRDDAEGVRANWFELEVVTKENIEVPLES